MKMTRKTYKKPQSDDITKSASNGNETMQRKPVAAYFRQSTNGQVGNVSTAMQQDDLPAYLESLGWTRDLIIHIDQDMGVSGRKSISERKGLSKIYDLILDGKIGAVACVHEDRLFRDETLIQPNIFIDACKRKEVTVITPNMEYRFHDPKNGAWHSKMFRDKAESAADYIKDYVRDRLHGARRKLALEGKHNQNAISAGYMVRLDIVKGKRTKHGVYEPFKPVADVVANYFELFVNEFRGNMYQTAQYIAKFGPYYPDFDDPDLYALVPDGCEFRKPLNMPKKNGHYYPSVETLIRLLTDAVYIGHWAVKGQIVKWGNHPPIVDNDLFFAAFNYLSPVGLDGETNPDYCPNFSRSRKYDPTERNEETPPFLKGLLYAEDNGEILSVATMWNRPHDIRTKGRAGLYLYAPFRTQDNNRSAIWSKRAHFIDNIAHQELQTALKRVSDMGVVDALNTLPEQQDAKKRQLVDMRNTLERKMKARLKSLDVLTTPDMIRDSEAQYQEYAAEKRRIEEQITKIDAVGQKRNEFETLREDMVAWYSKYPKLTYEQKLLVRDVCIRRVVASIDQNDIILTFYWNDGTTSKRTIAAKGEDGWTNAETTLLVELAESGADQLTIWESLPDRTWRAIAYRYQILTGKTLKNPHKAQSKEKYEDYLWRTAENLDNDGRATVNCISGQSSV
jgi:hypothetical protein